MPSGGQEPLLTGPTESNEQPAPKKRSIDWRWWCCSQRGCGVGLSILLLVLVLCVAALQYFLYEWGMGFKCGPKHLEHYDFPGGGEEELLDDEVILTIDHGSRWGWAAEVYPAREGRKTGAASTGKIWRTWGPIWYTYAYQDNQGKYTFVARDRPISLGGSHWLMRCDGQGNSSSFVYNVGGNLIWNDIYYLLGSQITSTYDIWKGGYWTGTKEATVQRAGNLGADANSQLNFNMIGEDNRFATGNLLQTNHNNHKEWYVMNNQLARNSTQRVPHWVPTMITSMFAIHLSEKFQGHVDQSAGPSFMAELGNRSVASELPATLVGVARGVLELPVAPRPETTAANQTFFP